MKMKIVVACALLALACAVKAETLSFTSTFKAEDVTLVPAGNGETLIDLADGRLGSGEFGRPAIPTKSFAVRLPADTAVAGCKVTLGETVLIAEDVTPVCEQRPVPGIADDPEPTPRDAVAYASADPYPAARAVYVATSSMRGIKIASFRLAPVWYVAAEKKLYLAKSVTVEIEIQPVPQPLAANVAVLPASDLFEAAANSLVINPSVPRYAKSVSRGGSGCQYLVITSNSFVSVAQKLADFRADFNHVTAAVVDTATIDSNYSGTDLPEKIRACIKWYVQNKGTEYVVLAGDDTVVPARMAKLDSSLYPSATAMELVTPSDIYYSDLDATWTKDSSDVTWGSWNCTSTYSGLAPDVIVGRLPVRTRTQLDGYITKLVAYEQDTGDDSDIVRKTLFGGYTCWEELYRKSGGWEQHYVYSASSPSVTQSSVTSLPETFNDGLREVGDRTTVGLLAADVEVWARRLNRDFHRTYYPCLRTSFFFNSATSWDKSTSTNSLQTVTRFMEVLNQGYHQLFFDTHGGFNSWGLGGTFTYDGSSTRGYKDSYRSVDAERLAGRVDFIYTSACNTGAFDLEEPSLSEGFLRASGGAIGYIGCSRYGWDIQMGKVSGWGPSGGVSGPSKDFARAFWKRLFVSKDRTLGAAFANHKNAMISDTSYQDYNKWLQLGINLQGDPLATYHLPSSDETRTSAKPGLVTLLRDNPIVTTADGATIGLAADEIPCGKTAKVELEYSKNSNFSSSTSVTVAPSLANQDELRHSLSGLSAGTTYYVRGKITVDGQTNLSPFSLSFTTKAAGTATVAGRVENLTGRALAGITVSAVAEGGATVATATTDANGSYQLAVPSGWTGTIVLSDSAGRISDGLSKPVSLASNALVTLDFKASGAPFYVKQGATGSGDGSSWANAFTTLDAAFATVEPGSIVWVAEGVYTPDTTLYGRDSHFAPPAYVAVYGGFAGNETSLEERDWIAHPTVLSADIGTKGAKTDNCYHVVRYNKGVLIDGFGLTGAYLDSTVRSAGYEDNYGAVVGTPLSNPAPVPSSTYPAEAPDEVLTLDHCAITNNVVPKRNGSGYGDLTSSSAKAVVRIRNTFVADNDVAGPHLFTNVSVENCTLTRNKSYSSGLCNCLVRNCLYLGNQKEVTGQGEPGTTSGTSWRGEDFFIYFYDNKVSAGSGNFMADSYYIRSDQNLGITGDILASGNNPAGWITDADTGFAYALNEESGAAEKGKVLEWMTEDTLDYLGHPRVHGTVPDLGCCEAVADSGGDDDDDDDDEIIRPEDAPVAEESVINAMTWETLFPTAKTYADSATSFNLPYRQHSPTTADGVKYPLVIFLHGAGESGDDNAKQVQTPNDVIPITKYAMKHGDAFVLAPQCPGASGNDYSLTWSGADWNVCPMTRLDTPTKPMAAVIKLITDFMANNPVDPTRVYVTGLSMGGFGTWDLASRMTTTFAAVMPCCGGVDASAAELYRGQSIRFFHGAEDKVVVPQFSRAMTNALTQAGIAYDYIEYPGTGHEACWRKAYVDTEDNLEWLFGHIKGEEYVAPDHGDTTPNAPLSTIANGGWLGWKLDKDATTIVNCGTKVWAYAQNYSCVQGGGHYLGNLVVNGVEFTKSGSFGDMSASLSCDRTFSGKDTFGTEDLKDNVSDFARMLKTGWEAVWDQGPVQTYTLHGLTAGNLYLVQFIYPCASKDRAGLSVIAPDGTTSTRVSGWDANGQNLDENWRYGGSLVGVFTASGSDQTLVITYSKTANYILNAVQLREVTVADLTDGPAIEYGTPTIGSVTPSVNGTTATLTLANVASGENGGCYQVWLAYAEDGVTLGNETAALISQQSASCAVQIKNLTAGKKYNYSLYVKNEGNVISAKKTGSFTIPGGEEPVDPEDISNPTKALVNHFTFNLSSRRFYDCIQERDAVLIDKDLATIENLSVADVPSTVTDYNKAIALPQNTGLKVAHSIPTNAAHPYCLVIRFYSPLASHGTWRALYQTIQENNTDASLFLQNSNDGGIGKGGETSWRGYYGSVSDDVWHSLVVSVDTVNSVSALYLDGTKIREISSASGPNDLTGRPYIYFGLDNDGEDNTLYFDDIRIYNEAKPLAVFDGDSVRAGGPDDTIGGGDPEPPADQEWIAIPMTESGDAFSTDGDLVFAFCRDQADPGSTRCNEATSIPINLVNLLTDTVTSITGGASINGVYDDGRNPGDFVAASPELSSATDQLGNEEKGYAWDTWGTILSHAWTGPSLSETDGKATFTFKGLTEGHEYLVEFFVHDHGQTKTVTAPDGETAVTYGGTGWQYGGILRGTFTAEGTTHDVVLTYSDSGSYMLNALQLREVEAAQEDDPVVPPPIYQLTIPVRTGLVLDSVKTNGTSVAGAGGVYSVVSNTEVTITFAAADGYELDGNEGVVTKTIVSNYTFADADYPAVKEQGGEDPVDPPVGPGGGYAVTGAEEIIDGDYVVYVWNDPTQSGTLTISGSVTADYLVVGGGGAGGYCRGGGGGGGGVVYKTAQTLGAGVYTITVGAGGTPDTFSTDGACYQKSKTSESANGGSSSISVSAETVCEAFGGGGGGNFVNGSTANSEGLGYVSGSRNVATGGGSTGKSTTAPSGREGQGFAGGAAFSGGDNSSGGGGGAGAVGLPATASRVSGNGGAGVVCAITGEEAYYGGGGGAGVYCNTNDGESNRGTSGEGGLGGGGHGGTFHNDDLTAGTDGLGGGGGGASGCGNKFDYCGGAKGGSGVVIIRLPRATGKEDDPAETGVWTAQPVSSDAREFSTDGDLVWAMTCSSADPGRTHYVNGIPFGDCGFSSGTDYLLSDYAEFSPAMNGAVDKFGYEGLDTDAMKFGGTLARGWFNANGTGNFAMTLKGLTAGRKYCVQIFTHNSGENKNDNNDGMTSDTITAPDGEKTITYGGEGWKYGGILTGTFVATNTQHSFAFTHSRSSYFQVNAIQLREIETVTPPPAHEHVWSDWVTNTPPTATTPGERTRTCIAAGCTVPPVTETEVVPATGGGDEPGEDDPDEPGSIAEAVSKLAPGDWLAAPLTGRAADIVTKGNFVSACAPFEIVGDESVNNVSFSADKGDPNKQFVGALTVDIGNKPGAGTYTTSGFDSASGYGKILGNAWYAVNGMTKKFTYSNLTVGKTYLVQLFVHDGRTAQIGRTATAPGDSTKSVKYGDVNDTDTWYYGGTLIHVFTTTNTTYEFNVDYPSNAPQINAIQLRVIEATASWTAKPMTLAGNGNGAAFCEEGTQVFAFMPDDSDQGTTATNLFACNVPVYLLNSLTDTVSYLHDATQKEWNWQDDHNHPWNGVFNDGRQPADFMAVEPALSRNTGCETVNGASDDFKCVLKRAFINYNGGKTMTVVFKNLTVGTEYVAELYVHHEINGGQKYVTAPDGVTKAYFGAGDWLYGGILSGRFVAKTTQESFTFTYSADNARQFNAIQLRELGGVTPPEPKCGFLLIVR